MSLDATTTTTYPATDPSTATPDAAPPLSHADLRQLVDTIHTMQEVDQYQVFELIQQDTNKYTENRNGVFVNLSHLDDATLQKLATFVQYWTIQREAIAKTEAESKSLAAQFGGARPDDEAGGGVTAVPTTAHAKRHTNVHGGGGPGPGCASASGVGTVGSSSSAPAHHTSAAHTVATDAQRERESTKMSAVVANELTEAERDLVKVSVENRRISLHKGKKHRFEGSAARVARKCLHSSDDGSGA